MDIEAIHAERADLVKLVATKEHKLLSTEDRMQRYNRLAELDKIISNFGYSQMSLNERINWWTQATHQQMRVQAEEGQDQLSIFDSTWYEHAVEKEPHIAEVLNNVCDRLRLPSVEVLRLIQYKIGSEEWQAVRISIKGQVYV